MRGKFIVCEGTDGSGKGTQAKLLAQRLQNEGIRVKYFDFPQYNKNFFGTLVGEFLSGELGDPKLIPAKLASLPYALDRWKAAPEIRAAIEDGFWSISNRYSLSNTAHRTASLPQNKREAFMDWLEELEYNQLGIPREDNNYFLYVPSDIGQNLLDKKGERDYMHGKGKDLLESDLEHQQTAAEMYKLLATRYPHITTFNCCDSEGKLLPIEKIHEMVWTKTLELYGNEIHEGRIRQERG